MEKHIGINIGGTNCSIVTALIDSDTINILKTVKFKTLSSYQETIDKFISLIEEEKDYISIGISCGGPLDPIKGIITCPPNLPGWVNIPIVEILKNKFNVPVFLENDANAGALAEWSFGAAKGKKNVIFLTYGTGNGSGLILDNHLYRGTNYLAGEVGHIRLSDMGPVGFGKFGSFDGMCSGTGLKKIAQMVALSKIQIGEKTNLAKNYEDIQNINGELVGKLAANNDEDAIEAFKIQSHYLANGLSILIDIINPETIVMGGVYMRNEKLIFDLITPQLKRESISYSYDVCEIKPAKLGENIGEYSALVVSYLGLKGVI